jgi:hypothetical protein
MTPCTLCVCYVAPIHPLDEHWCAKFRAPVYVAIKRPKCGPERVGFVAKDSE